jgi:segregation and condensation protein A
VHKLIEALDRLMRNAKVRISHEVLIDRLSVSQRIMELTDRLEREPTFAFTSMFRFASADVEMTYEAIRNEAVVTLLAILEMAKLRLIALSQHEGDDEIWIARAVDDLRAQMDAKVAHADGEYR